MHFNNKGLTSPPLGARKLGGKRRATAIAGAQKTWDQNMAHDIDVARAILSVYQLNKEDVKV
jgi:hypothetical protein